MSMHLTIKVLYACRWPQHHDRWSRMWGNEIDLTLLILKLISSRGQDLYWRAGIHIPWTDVKRLFQNGPVNLEASPLFGMYWLAKHYRNSVYSCRIVSTHELHS